MILNISIEGFGRFIQTCDLLGMNYCMNFSVQTIAKMGTQKHEIYSASSRGHLFLTFLEKGCFPSPPPPNPLLRQGFAHGENFIKNSF